MREFELIRELLSRLPDAPDRVRIGPGDDAAVVSADGETAVTVDALIEGVHFRVEQFPPAAIGRKALAAALSDLAAMGAEPGEAYVTIGIPPGFGEARCLELYEGIATVTESAGVAVLGGDVNRSGQLLLAVTAVGRGEPGTLVGRSGARPGDAVAVTGELGGAAAGLLLLEGSEPGDAAAQADALRARQLAPTPRLAEGKALAATGARAMIDISDGLGADADHVARASGVRLRIEIGRAPIQDGVREVAAASGRDPLELARAGEDYELLACLPPEAVDAARDAVERTGGRLTIVGEALEGEGAELVGLDGLMVPLGGFDHLA